MPNKKEKILEKIVKKNYNNELELVLENKSFDENTKSILLSTLYKLETAYHDYQQVKINVMPKDEFLQMIIDVIKNDVDTIKLIKIGSKEAKILEGKELIVDKEKKQIICYPIEKIILYALSKISKKDIILKDKYFVINQTISDLLSIGNNINTVEAMRDFNGFAWDIVTKDIESIEHNLIYQNLRIIVGSKFLNKWIYNKEVLLDYFETFKSKLEDLYGEQIKDAIVDSIIKMSVLLEVKYKGDNLGYFIKSKIEVENNLSEISNNEEFIKKLTKNKKDLNKQIRNIDKIVNDRNLLQNEYRRRNEKLPLEKKIFSMRVLANMLKEEREELETRRKKINKMLNPKQFIKYKKELEVKYSYLKFLDVQDVEKEIQDEMINAQNLFLEAYKIKIQKAKSKSEMVKLLIEFRYYLNIPISKSIKVGQVSQLEGQIWEIEQLLIGKAVQMKVLINILNDMQLNFLILKELFNSKIINLKGININFSKKDGMLVLQMYDENVLDKQIVLGDLALFDLSKFAVKLNKNIKVFCI